MVENPYVAPTATPGPVVYRTCGFWWRALASVIDYTLLMIVILSLEVLAYGTAYFESEKRFEGPVDVFLCHGLPCILWVACWVKLGGTPGKLWLGIKLVDGATGKRVGWGKAIGRYFAYIPSSLALGLGYLWMIWDRRGQCWHDKLAGTLVVRRQAA